MPKPPVKRRDPFSPEVSGVRPAEDELKAQLEIRERRQAKNRRAKRPKQTYDLPLSLIEAVQAIADEEGVSQSDIAAWALADFVEQYRANQIDLREHMMPAKSLRFTWKLVLPAKWR